MCKTFKISISGQVQGVGFRPYVYNLAIQFSLAGTVSNNEEGVIIYLSGITTAVKDFYSKLIQLPPPVSKIKQHSITEIPYIAFDNFKIIQSSKENRINLPLTPDFALCDTCKKEISDPKNRRFNYPFTTCVNCGPRWAITSSFPFERDHTSLTQFSMCTTCKKEYTSPNNRRFHSQTNTCTTCGIELQLVNANSKKIEISKQKLLKKIAELIRLGNIIAIKNTSGYLLCCNAEDKQIIEKLRLKKNRPNKPFAVLYPNLGLLKKEIRLTENQEKLLTSTVSPITIVSTQEYSGNIALQQVAPGLNQLGVMLPFTGILQLLANVLNFPIIATSGNIHGSPIIRENSLAIENLKNVADYFLIHDLNIVNPQDDSVIKISSKFEIPVLFRRSRGFAPNYFKISIKSSEKIIAMGAHLKSTIAFYPNEYLYLSQYLGNLDNFDVFERFSQTTKKFMHFFEQGPQVVLVDKHPQYQSSRYGKELAKNSKSKLVEVQHHKAHFAAILGEHQLFSKKVLGVVFDGTGYGDDGAIWGGEFFNYESNQMNRLDHVDYFDWLLGDKMSKEPRVSLLALSNPKQEEVISKKFTHNEYKSYQYIKNNNQLKTSSIGRIFDAVASLLNLTDTNTYEGEAPILLENALTQYDLKNCKSYLNNPAARISGHEIIQNIFVDVEKGHTKEQIIGNFFYTLAFAIVNFSIDQKYKHIALSGGVFQNTILIDMLLELAPKEICIYFHSELSPNDENISFGQMMYYLKIKN